MLFNLTYIPERGSWSLCYQLLTFLLHVPYAWWKFCKLRTLVLYRRLYWWYKIHLFSQQWHFSWVSVSRSVPRRHPSSSVSPKGSRTLGRKFRFGGSVELRDFSLHNYSQKESSRQSYPSICQTWSSLSIVIIIFSVFFFELSNEFMWKNIDQFPV